MLAATNRCCEKRRFKKEHRLDKTNLKNPEVFLIDDDENVAEHR